MRNTKIIAWLFVSAIMFYIAALVAYTFIYIKTLDLIEFFSENKISFYGKLRGPDSIFGLISASIPISLYLCHSIIRTVKGKTLSITIFCFLFLLIVFYILNCYLESISLITSNDFYGQQNPLIYSLNKVNPNRLIGTTLVAATVITTVINIAIRIKSKRALRSL